MKTMRKKDGSNNNEKEKKEDKETKKKERSETYLPSVVRTRAIQTRHERAVTRGAMARTRTHPQRPVAA